MAKTTERPATLPTVLASLDGLTEAIHEASRRRRALVNIGTGMVVLMLGLIGLQLQISSDNRTALRSSNETLAIVKAAVDPNSELGQRGRDATLAALTSINCTTLYLHDIHLPECATTAAAITAQRGAP